MAKKYIEIKHLVLNDLADVLKKDDIKGAFDIIGNDVEERNLFYNFLIEILEINPLSYFNTISKNFFTGMEVEKVVVPDNVKVLEPGCFANSKVQMVEFQTKSVAEIPAHCFEGSKDLVNVTLPSSITYLGENAFNGCSNKLLIYTPAEAVSKGFSFYMSPDPDAAERDRLFMKQHLKLVK